MCCCPCEHDHQRLIKTHYNSKNPDHFYPDPIRRDLQKKHQCGTDKAMKINPAPQKPERIELQKSAYLNSLVLYYADSAIPMRSVERPTFYECQRKMFQLGQMAGKDAKFEEIFENEKIQTRRKLADDTAEISEEFQKLLRLVN